MDGSDGPVLGFEANGGVMLASPIECGETGARLDPLPTRDAILPILAVLGTAAERRVPLSRLREIWPLPASESDRLKDFPQDASHALFRSLRRSRSALATVLSPIGAVAAVDDLDGLRVTLSSGEVVHLRASGNAPELRCYAEAVSADRARALIAQVFDLVTESVDALSRTGGKAAKADRCPADQATARTVGHETVQHRHVNM